MAQITVKITLLEGKKESKEDSFTKEIKFPTPTYVDELITSYQTKGMHLQCPIKLLEDTLEISMINKTYSIVFQDEKEVSKSIIITTNLELLQAFQKAMLEKPTDSSYKFHFVISGAIRKKETLSSFSSLRDIRSRITLLWEDVFGDLLDHQDHVLVVDDDNNDDEHTTGRGVKVNELKMEGKKYTYVLPEIFSMGNFARVEIEHGFIGLLTETMVANTSMKYHSNTLFIPRSTTIKEIEACFISLAKHLVKIQHQYILDRFRVFSYCCSNKKIVVIRDGIEDEYARLSSLLSISNRMKTPYPLAAIDCLQSWFLLHNREILQYISIKDDDRLWFCFDVSVSLNQVWRMDNHIVYHQECIDRMNSSSSASSSSSSSSSSSASSSSSSSSPSSTSSSSSSTNDGSSKKNIRKAFELIHCGGMGKDPDIEMINRGIISLQTEITKNTVFTMELLKVLLTCPKDEDDQTMPQLSD